MKITGRPLLRGGPHAESGLRAWGDGVPGARLPGSVPASSTCQGSAKPHRSCRPPSHRAGSLFCRPGCLRSLGLQHRKLPLNTFPIISVRPFPAEESRSIFTATSRSAKQPPVCVRLRDPWRNTWAAEPRRGVTPEQRCPLHLEGRSPLIHLVNGSGRKALCVQMTKWQPMYHKTKIIAFFFPSFFVFVFFFFSPN